MIKTKLKHLLIDSNPYIKEDYQRYLEQDKERHWKDKKAVFIKVLKLNLKYRVFHRRESKWVREISATHESKTREEYLEKLLSYDLIVFDPYESLLCWTYDQWEALYYFMEVKYKYMNFKTLRIEAEGEAMHGGKVRIEDIYEVLEQKNGLNGELWMARELQEIKDATFHWISMKEVYQKVREEKKTIVMKTDSYLSEDMWRELFLENGYPVTDGIYNWNRDTKDNLDEFIHVNYPGQSYIQAHDQIREYVHDRTESLKPAGMTTLAGSLYKGLIKFRGGNRFQEFGYLNGGFLLCGYCEWMNRLAERLSIDKILFLSRDGYRVHKVYNQSYKEYENEYVYFSRVVGLKITFERNIEAFIDQLIRPYVFSKNSLTMIELLKASDLECLSSLVVAEGLNVEDFVKPEHYTKIKFLIYKHQELIKEVFAEIQEAAYQYFTKQIGNCNRVLIVDVGWYGSGALAIKYLLEEKYQTSYQIFGALVGTREGSLVDLKLSDDTLHAFAFSTFHNTDILHWHNHMAPIHDILVEILFSAPEPSFLGFTRSREGQIGFVFAEEEKENQEVNVAIEEGMLSFVKLYTKYTSKNPSLITISPKDAYLPIMNAMKDKKYCYHLLKDYCVYTQTGRNMKGKIRRLGDLMTGYGYV